jgi:ribosomal protein S18 acetylase RimI-like enzyme
MSQEIELRMATPGDAGRLAVVAASMFADTFGNANRREDMDSYLAKAFTEASQRAELLDARNRILLAIADGDDIAGYVHLRLGVEPPPSAEPTGGRQFAEIARLYADRRWHGKGIGATLMKASLELSREWGADVVWLGVWERNARAIAFYQKTGFDVIGEQTFLLGRDVQRDLVMARHLTSEG